MQRLVRVCLYFTGPTGRQSEGGGREEKMGSSCVEERKRRAKKANATVGLSALATACTWSTATLRRCTD